ncbi:MAG: OmpH family outer membrane protein [Pseudomonadota bacterium]
MTVQTHIASLFAVLFAAAAVLASPAAAKEPIILIVNQQALLVNSKAGKNIANQLEGLKTTIEAEFNTEVEKVAKEGEDLEKQKDLISKEALQEKARTLLVKRNSLPTLREAKFRELQLSEQKALGVIGKELQPILQKIVERRGATLLLDRSAVMYASTDNDITEEVMKELDKKLPKVAVEHVRIVKTDDGKKN